MMIIFYCHVADEKKRSREELWLVWDHISLRHEHKTWFLPATGFPYSSVGKESICNAGAATATAKSLQSCPTLCDPIDGSPPGSPTPGILQARILEWVAISFSNAWKWKMKVKSLGCLTLSDPMDCSLPGSSVHGIYQPRVLKWGDPGSIPGSGRYPGKGTGCPLQHPWASFVAQLVKNLPAMRETWVWSLGWEDPLEKGKTTHSSILA